MKQYFAHSYGPNKHASDLSLGGNKIKLPYCSMGNLDSLCLFGIDELIIFALYKLYADIFEFKSVSDIGANIGLHTIILSKLGYQIRSFEPDPNTFKQLKDNIRLNNITDSAELNNTAVSSSFDPSRFVRVCGNTMSSHIMGSKSSPHGTLETIVVNCTPGNEAFSHSKLVKIDAESHELPILKDALTNNISRPEIIMEVGIDTPKNELFDLLTANGYMLYSQMKGWSLVLNPSELPASHHEGTLVCSQNLFKHIIKSTE